MTLTADDRTVTRTVKKGQPWEHLLMVRSRRTHWTMRPSAARAAILLNEFGSTYPIEATISAEGGIMLYLSADDTANLPAGDLAFDVLADWWQTNTPSYPSGTYFTDYVIKAGVLRVVDYNPITPRSTENNVSIEFELTQYEDFTRWVSVADANGDPMEIEDGYIVVKDALGTVVFTSVYTDPAPNEAALAAMDPAERGYIGAPPSADYTLTWHISDKAVIPAGLYPFQVYVQEASSDDMVMAFGGTLRVFPGSVAP